MPSEEKEVCLICIETPGWVFINDPRQEKPEPKRCPNGCKREGEK